MPFKNPHTLYTVWQSMKGRCLNPKNKQFSDYGGRGIKICDQWITNFTQFVVDMGERPFGYSLDRIDNNKGYSPENCRWASRETQQKNQRRTHKVVFDGVEYILCDLAKKYGFKTDTLVQRAKTAKTYEELIDKNRKVYKEGLALGGKASGQKKQSLTHCKNGHEFNEKNTHISKEGWRSCRECHRIRQYIRTH